MHEHGHLLAVAVGNTRTRFGVFHGNELENATSMANEDPAALAQAIVKAAEGEHGVSVVVGSVNPAVSDPLVRALEDSGERVFRIGTDLPVPMPHSLEDATTLGQDRILCAYGAFARARQACVVIDVGTAVTVDFVDGEGIFHGGVIAPGLRMMLGALHEKTAALPAADLQQEAARLEGAQTPFGKDTRQAMALGVLGSVRGLVHFMIERYAEFYEGYPQIVATGGDAPLLFEKDELVEHIVPDLQLVGILEVARAVENSEQEEQA
jgi:type III pantothenate kinase